LIKNLYLSAAIFPTICYKDCVDLGFNTHKLIIFYNYKLGTRNMGASNML
jgi:hypothetical protein